MKAWRPTGGQSIPAFDHYMAPGVAKSFCKEIKKVLDIRYPECDYGDTEQIEDGSFTNSGIYEALKQYRNVNRLIMNEEGYKFIRELLKSRYCKALDAGEISMILKQAERLVEDDTHQAMEAVVHNLNSMHCLPYHEKLWVYDVQNKTFDCVQIGELAEKFETNRFMVVSLNKNTGKSEFKFITAVKKMGNNRRLIKITSNQGASVTVTDNHKVMTISGLSITDGYPDDISCVISPRGIWTPSINNDICLEEYNKVRIDSSYVANHIPVTEDFAELMGYYTANGSLTEDKKLSFITFGKLTPSKLSDLASRVFGKECMILDSNFKDSVCFDIGKQFIGMIADKFGDGIHCKKVPIEILFGTGNIKEAFLRAYFMCSESKDIHEGASYVNTDLARQIGFLLLSVKASPHLSVLAGSSNAMSVCVCDDDRALIGLRKNIEDKAKPISCMYDLSMVPNNMGNIKYHDIEDMINEGLLSSDCSKITNFFVNSIESKEELNSGDEYVYDISVADNENFMTADGIYVHNSRAGAQVV